MSARLSPIHPDILRADSTIPVVLLVDHASNHIPAELDGLGLDPKYLNEHIAVDLGADALARKLSAHLGAAAVLANVSRLVIDANRELDRASLIPTESDAIPIPGNQMLSTSERAARIDAYYHPYHAACRMIVQRHLAAGRTPLLLAVHSFTPVYGGQTRPWEVGFLYNKDARLAHALIDFLARETNLTIGDNQPYSGADLYHTMYEHGMCNGLAQTTLEVRQDQLDTAEKIASWAALLADGLDACLQRADVVGVKSFL